jgi:rhodanese-related sulfurtransferase
MKRAVTVLALVFVATVASAYAFGWTLVTATIRREFPDVPRISTEQLAAWLHDSSRPAPLLLDVRTRAEYEVSHLADARHAEPDAAPSVIDAPKDRAIVTYCSVGYRSSVFARKLRGAGFTNVQNLEGSIFKWANEGRPVYRAATEVADVHPYNHTWGLLLAKKHRARAGSR